MGLTLCLCAGPLDSRRLLSTTQLYTLRSGCLTCLSSQTWPSKQSTRTCPSTSSSSKPGAMPPVRAHAHTCPRADRDRRAAHFTFQSTRTLSLACPGGGILINALPIWVRMFCGIIVADTDRNGTQSRWKSGRSGYSHTGECLSQTLT